MYSAHIDVVAFGPFTQHVTHSEVDLSHN